ncbi:uncharacterized protein Z520_09000 [Fonsecaea multimorphosa CBS 102226]|uniref:BZIP domain-containing protein n=1 Tax=Fonsecaea multimorphosa CBS 102226 TaxID=1442371 RepID=A0A0D2JX42_9EURO|nr:uncharacterized protein Z520_09000 [Fonsecaea multimorphosa CBS 102226]KIX95084.1 hypothetical protein Z520_09000 [Fonsecaea multimorphosa CBS 102226]
MAQTASASNPALCKRTRKREMDRICQQRKRKRDRENLRNLEQRLQILQDEKPDSLLAQLIKDRDDNEARNNRHRTRMLQIQGLLRADLTDLGHSETTTSPDYDGHTLQTQLNIESDSSSASEPAPLDQTLVNGYGETSPLGVLDDLYAIQAFEIDSFGAQGPEPNNVSLAQHTISGGPEPVNDTAVVSGAFPIAHNSAGRQRKTWEEVEQLIAQAKSQLSGPSTATLELDMHIIINAVSRGWSQFSQIVRVDTRWSCLRELDEKYFRRGYGPVERLAVLTIASQLIGGDMTTNSVGSKLFPPFMKPRPSQLTIPHSVIADFYVWPGFRERLTVCQHYYSDTFLRIMHTMFRFMWPYDLKAASLISPQTGLSHFTPRFLEHLKDIQCWTMNSDFLAAYPDFRGEVPVWNSGPAGLLTTGVTYSDWYQFEDRIEEESARTNLHPIVALGF